MKVLIVMTYLCSKSSGMCFYSFVLQYGMQLYQNYMHPCHGRSGCSSQSISPMVSTKFLNLYFILYLYDVNLQLHGIIINARNNASTFFPFGQVKQLFGIILP